jgi:hypothetical protein
MTKHFLLSTAAAALIAGTGFAYAQGTGMGGSSSGSTMQQSAPSTEQGRGSATTPMHNDSGMSKEGTSRGSESGHRAQDTHSGKMKNERSAEEYGKGDHSKGMRSERNESGKSDKGMRAEDHNGKTEERNRRTEDRNGKAMDHNRNAEERNGMKSDSSRNAADTNRSSTTTTGQAGAGAKLSTEQRTKITTVIRNQHVQPTTNVNFSIAVGTRVPRTVSFHPLPTEIVDIYPSWRGYEFFLVRDQIVVVDPRTLEIVAVREA